ncbi:MAG: lysophospholipase [bacterium]|nr:lysophospholipase [bacterium]
MITQYRIGLILLLLLLSLSSCVRTVTEESLFYPHRTPALSDSTTFRSIELRASDGVMLRGKIIGAPHYQRSMICFVGNAESIYRTFNYYAILSQKTECNLYLIDYRGFGISDSAKPTFASIIKDALLIFDTVRVRTPSQPLFLFGYSIGTVFATAVASERAADGLILIAPMTNAEETIKAFERELPWYLRWFIWLKPEAKLQNPNAQPVELIKQVTEPLLVMHGERDNLIPIALGRKLFASAASSEKRFLPVPKRGHSEWIALESPYTDSLKLFLIR